jgi:hypothetical protein
MLYFKFIVFINIYGVEFKKSYNFIKNFYKKNLLPEREVIGLSQISIFFRK